MIIKWTSSESRILPGIGMAETGREFEVDDAVGSSYVLQGLAMAKIPEVVIKPTKSLNKETE